MAKKLFGVVMTFLILFYTQQMFGIQIPVGTVVSVSPTSTISSESAFSGSKAPFVVVEDVVIDGVTVISRGNRAEGMVRSSKGKSALGNEGELILELEYAYADNGEKVPLNAVKIEKGRNALPEALVITLLCCILGLLIEGGPAEIGPNTVLSAEISSSVNIDMNKTVDGVSPQSEYPLYEETAPQPGY